MADVNSISFRRSTGGNVLISTGALEKFVMYRQKTSDSSEAGGVLVGRLIMDSEDIIIDDATSPHKKDKRFRFAFWRSRKPHQEEVDKAWESSKGTSNYLGEWHSHPENEPQPSSQDLRNWKRIVKKAKYDQKSLLFIIIGRTNMCMWEMGRSDSEPTELLIAK